MAYELIKRLQEKELSKILLQLKEALTDRDFATGQKTNYLKIVLMQSDLPPEISFAKNKFIHRNLVVGTWKLMEHLEFG